MDAWVQIAVVALGGLLGLVGGVLGGRVDRRTEFARRQLVSRAGSSSRFSTAQLPAGRTGERPEYNQGTRAFPRHAQRKPGSADKRNNFRRGTLDEQIKQRALVERYQEPLVRAAYDLQSRLWNILRHDLLRAYAQNRATRGWEYARDSTVWLFGQYFGWAEIVRREVQFLALSEPGLRRELQTALGAIAHACSSDRSIEDPLFRLFRSEQRGLGELMIIEGRDAEGKARTDCMGFAAFSAKLASEGSQLARWFSPLREDVESLAEEPTRTERLTILQHALLDLLDMIDPRGVRFPVDRERV